MKKAIYAFSGDPITYGHIDIIERASKVFDKVVVGIGANPEKKYMFSLEERTKMAQRSLAKFPNVEVVSFQGLLVDYAYENEIKTIVKGVRNATDFDYENILHQVGESQKLGIDTHILFAKPKLAHVSSSVVKAIQKEQGLIHEYVPLYVKQCLESRMSGQYIVGITGEIGAGKSYVSKKFVEIGKEKGINVYDIDLDSIGHQILGELKQPKYEEVRKEISNIFGKQVKKQDGTIDRKLLGEIVFSNPNALEKLNKIMYTPLLVRLRRELYDKKGLILFNAALIAESDMSFLCNNNTIVIYADKKIQESRLISKNLTSEQIQRRLSSQFDFQEKKNNLEQVINRDKQGKIWILDNSGSANSNENIKKIFTEVVSELRVK